jgi:hypothetical protein
MKVVFCIPALDGSVKTRFHQSLVATYRILNQAGIAYEEFFVENCPYLPTARNTLAAMFLNDPEATDLFFIDSDVGFDPVGVVKILERPEEVVAGIYPLKRDLVGYPVEVQMQDRIPIGRDIGGIGLISANFLPAGFMRIKRQVFEKLKAAYPQLEYAGSVVEVLGANVKEAWDFFHMGIDPERQRWTTEDYAFCQRCRDIGIQLWVYPDINFQHIGSKAYQGNYHEYLLRLPGGAKDPARMKANEEKEIL